MGSRLMISDLTLKGTATVTTNWRQLWIGTHSFKQKGWTGKRKNNNNNNNNNKTWIRKRNKQIKQTI